MYRLLFTPAAQNDLVSIATYIESSSGDVGAARSVTARLVAHCEKIAGVSTVLGRLRPELALGLRSLPSGRYVLLFRYVEDQQEHVLEIVGIIHGRRDIFSLFDNRKADRIEDE